MELLQNMVAVGRVTPHSVRLWCRVEQSAELCLQIESPAGARQVAPFSTNFSSEGTCAFTYPDEFPGEAALAPATLYTFRIATQNGIDVGSGKFKTPPTGAADAPASWTLAFMSCHQPFDKEGQVTTEARNMLSVVNKVFEERAVEVILFLGDQIYADDPAAVSVFPEGQGSQQLLQKPQDEIRALYSQRYKQSWNLPDWQLLHARSATACVPDDHEVVDNWASSTQHCEPPWQKLGKAALDVAFSWQGSRSFPAPKPATFQQDFRWGNAGIFMMDARSSRRNTGTKAGSQVVDEGQMSALEIFLDANADTAVLFIAISVPLVYIPEWLTSLGHAVGVGVDDLNDRWSNPCWVESRDRLLSRLDQHRKQHPHQRLVLLSGDIHAGWAVSLSQANSPAHPILQLVSSAVTNGESSLVGVVSEGILRATKVLAGQVAGLDVRPVQGCKGTSQNPFGGLNVGLVEIARHGAEVTIRFQLVTHSQGAPGDEPRIVFDSGPL